MDEQTPITNTDDFIDTKDVLKRIEQLSIDHKDCFENSTWATIVINPNCPDEDEHKELQSLDNLIVMLQNNCDNEPEDRIFLIREDYFEEYAEQEAIELGMIPFRGGMKWPFNHINWKDAADELKNDYVEIDFDGVIYLTR